MSLDLTRYDSGAKYGDAAIKLARTYFTLACPGDTPWFHRVLTRWFFAADNRGAAAAPRGHAKSTIITQICVLACIALRLERNIIIASATLPLAVDHLRTIKYELENNEDFRKDFGIDLPAKAKTWNEDTIEFELDDGFSMRITAKGVGTSMRGTKYRNWRPSLAILDDVENEENTATPEARRKLRGWLAAVLVPAMSAKNSRIRIVGTYMHNDALLPRAMKSPTFLPLYLKAHDKDFKNILWPAMFSVEKFLALKTEFEEMGMPHVYSREYLNEFIAEEGAYFDMTQVVYMTTQPRGDGIVHICGVDLAISESARADYSVIVSLAVDVHDGFVTLIDMKRGRWDAVEIVSNLIYFEKVYRPTFYVFERGQIEQSIESFLTLEEQKHATYITKTYIPSLRDKKVRARTFQGVVRSGKFGVMTSIHARGALLHEMEQFGAATHDDTVDAVAVACMKLGEVLNITRLEDRVANKKVFDDERVRRNTNIVDAMWGSDG